MKAIESAMFASFSILCQVHSPLEAKAEELTLLPQFKETANYTAYGGIKGQWYG